ncbi:hypothetical protein, partial [Streptococcus alactolyticus]|uniref:hypothetical protein n=1 Tax=Streptococcus alactolyticus TaxID=29389 RepID=UPI00195ACFFF
DVVVATVSPVTCAVRVIVVTVTVMLMQTQGAIVGFITVITAVCCVDADCCRYYNFSNITLTFPLIPSLSLSGAI